MTATAIGAYATAAEFKRSAGITDTTDDTLIGLLCDRVNQYIETITMQPIAPISSATYTYDGEGLRRIFLPMPTNAATKGIGGLRAITLLEFGSVTAGIYTYTTVASTDFELRGRFGVAGPYRWLLMGSYPAGSYTSFPEFQKIRITGTAGWAAIPDDVTEMALSIAKNAWDARQAGYVDADDVSGIPSVARFVRGRDREILKKYTLAYPV